MQIFNSHVHTKNSPDCKASTESMAQSALESGLAGITITDHCNAGTFISDNAYSRIKSSVEESKKIHAEYDGRLYVGTGIEMGEMIWNMEYSSRILQMAEFDTVLASVHCLRDIKDGSGHLARMNFSKYSDEEIYRVLDSYYADLRVTATECDFDVLSHLTLPLRYAYRGLGRMVDTERYVSITDEILRTIVARGKALELNTSEVGGIGLMPDEKILRRYRELGGELVTIGSDAHVPQNISHGLDEGISCLKSCGFDGYVYYKKRKCVKINI